MFETMVYGYYHITIVYYSYPLEMADSLLLILWPIEIVDLPNLKMVIFQFAM